MRTIYADTLGFIGSKMGPPEFTPEIFVRLRQSGVRLVQWGGPHPMPKNGWPDLIEEVREVAKQIESHPDLFRLVRSRADLEDLEKTDLVYVIITVQNPYWIEEKWDRLDQLHKAGARVMQLAYWD